MKTRILTAFLLGLFMLATAEASHLSTYGHRYNGGISTRTETYTNTYQSSPYSGNYDTITYNYGYRYPAYTTYRGSPYAYNYQRYSAGAYYRHPYSRYPRYSGRYDSYYGYNSGY